MSQTKTVPTQQNAPARPQFTPRQQEWRAKFFQEKGWKSKQAQQVEVRNELKASLATTLQPGVGPNCVDNLATAKLEPGKEFKAYTKALEAYEKAPVPRDPQVTATLKGAAEAYVLHYNGHSKRQREQKHTLRKFTACSQTLDELRRTAETEAVLKLGQWDSKTAMKSASLKAEADFASLPTGQQTTENLGGNSGVNPAFWVNKAGSDGKDKTFLFKPMTNDSGRSSVPAGGEPSREAMTGRTADVLNGMTGLDFKVPETHIISVARSHMPDDMSPAVKGKIAGGDGTGPLVGSLQQFAKTNGEARHQSPAARRAVPPQRCQELAVLDIITLNVDRHGGNYLMTGDAKGADLVPIDNGLSFPENPDDVALMGRDHNAMLKMPGAHEPFSDEMKQAIAKIDPDALVGALKRERQTLNEVHGDPKLSDAALAQSRRSTMFLKLAAATLSPAAVQVALGQNAKALLNPDPAFDDNAFTALAQQVIQAVAAQQADLAEFFTASPDEILRRGDELKRLGWPREIVGNPQMAMVLVKQGVAPPQPPRLPPFNANAANPDDIKAMKAAYSKAADNDLPKWTALTAAGGYAGLLKALDLSGVGGDDRDFLAGKNIGAGLDFMLAFNAGKALMANPNVNVGQQRLLDQKEALIKDTAALLPLPQKTATLQRLAVLKTNGDVGAMNRLRDAIVGGLKELQTTEMKQLSKRARDGLDQADAEDFDTRLLADTPAAGGCIKLGFVLDAEVALAQMRTELQTKLGT